MEHKTHNAVKRYIDKMPSLSVTVSKIMTLANDPNASASDLNKIISLDPVLMGKVLRLVNSAYYGLNQKITSLVRAIIMLGINTIKNLALSTAVLGTFQQGTEHSVLDMEGFWRHSLCVGVTSRLLAKKRKIDTKHIEEYFIAGLLHDIGKIPLANALAQPYSQAIRTADADTMPLFISERDVIGTDHMEVGDMIAENWKLDNYIRDSIVRHHQPLEYEGTTPDILYTVCIANYYANDMEIGFAGDRHPGLLPQEIFTKCNLSLDYLDSIEEEIRKEIEKAKVFLETAAQKEDV